jgi:hypothetical protein
MGISKAGCRQKGAKAEIEVADLLQAWWSQLEPGCIFKRTPSSGGWASPDARRGFQTSGDLVTTAKRFPFTVECKRREISLRNFLAWRPSPVWGWWMQAQRQAKEQGGEPMLLLRVSRGPWMMLLRAEYVLGLPAATSNDVYNGGDVAYPDVVWPRARGARPVRLGRAEAIFAMEPDRFAL